MRYEFLVETYGTERIKVVSVWSEFHDEDLPVRPRESDSRGRSVHEQMVHQCVSENLWFINMLGIDLGAPPLPATETRLEFMKRYTEDSGKRLAELQAKDDGWWESETKFFDVQRSRAWVMVRRIAHTAHHRAGVAQQLRPNGGYGRAHAESCTDYLRLSESERTIRWRSRWRQEDAASGRRGQSRDRAPGQEMTRKQLRAKFIPVW